MHICFNVFDLDRSIKFYKEALGLEEYRRKSLGDWAVLVFLSDGETAHQLELTWLVERKEPYNLGDNEMHLAFYVDDIDAAHALHQEMGCICHENKELGVYFITDPDGYWLEILPPSKRKVQNR